MTLEELDIKAPDGAYSTFDSAVAEPYLRKLKYGQVYLEVGVDRGKSLWIARQLAGDGVVVVGVDVRPDPGVEGTIFIRGDSKKTKFEGKVDLIFIDGDHSYAGVKADIENWYPQMARGGVMMFHDCDETSPGVVKATREFTQKIGKTLWESPEQRCSMAVIEL